MGLEKKILLAIYVKKKMRKKIIYCEAMRRKKILKMRIFPRKNGSDCGKAAIFFWFSFRTNNIFCPKIKTITTVQDNLLFSYYHTETLSGTYSLEQVTVSNTVAHVFFFQLVNGKRYGLDRGNVC